jgi:hypothetical protein
MLSVTLVAGTAFGQPVALFLALRPRGSSGLWFGIPAGLLAGLSLAGFALCAGFALWRRSRLTRADPRRPGERLFAQGPANHLRGWEAVGGGLYLTDRRLLFRPHRFNFHRTEASIPLDEILRAETRATGGVIPNGLWITTPSGTERFVVGDRTGWVLEILRAKAACG